jgi:hypothetical protein
MPQDVKQNFETLASASRSAADEARYVQGAVFAAAEPEALRAALDEALSYRGDVTITLRDGRSIEGYLFDRRQGPTLETSTIRLIPSASTSLSGEEKVTVAYREITSLAFSGRDTAAGKTWENWIRRYAAQKLRGESAGIEAEGLD